MGIRHRRSVNLGGGVKLNLNTKSASVTTGGKAGRFTVGTSGRTTVSTSLPGTGLYYSKSSGGGISSMQGPEIVEARRPLASVLVGVAVAVLLVVVAVALFPKSEPAPETESAPVLQTVPAQTAQESVDISPIEALFPEADISIQTTSGHTGVIITTDLPAEEPENWEALKASLVEAMGQVSASKPIAAELRAADGTGLASLIGDKIMYDAFNRAEPVEKKKEETIVYIGSGSRYHSNSGCSGGALYPATISAAIRKGLTACKKCY